MLGAVMDIPKPTAQTRLGELKELGMVHYHKDICELAYQNRVLNSICNWQPM